MGKIEDEILMTANVEDKTIRLPIRDQDIAFMDVARLVRLHN